MHKISNLCCGRCLCMFRCHIGFLKNVKKLISKIMIVIVVVCCCAFFLYLSVCPYARDGNKLIFGLQDDDNLLNSIAVNQDFRHLIFEFRYFYTSDRSKDHFRLRTKKKHKCQVWCAQYKNDGY